MKQNHTIMAVHITDRLTEATAVQQLLTDFGKIIKTRLGLHETDPNSAGPDGLLLLELIGDDKATINDLDAKLNAVDGVEAKQVFFAH
jgi:hypothetical protein